MAEKANGNGKDKEAVEEEVVPVGPGAEGDEEIHAESEEEPRAAAKDDDEDEGDEKDERVGRSEDEEDGEADSPVRQRRRRERKARRAREKDDRVELRFLRQRNEALERRQSAIDARLDQVDVGAVDTRIGLLDEQIAEAERLHAEAITKQRGNEATEALQIRDQLRDQKANLANLRNQKVGQARQRQQQGGRPPIDPDVVRMAERWVEKNSDWFDPAGRDEDSRIARTIEDGMYAEGRLDARTPEYWDEYNRRLAKRGIGPDASRGRDRDRDDDADEEEAEDPTPEKRKPKGPRITTGGRERPLKKNEVYVSAERRAAMEEAGVWDKPDLRAKYLRRYAAYDAEHKNDRR